MAQIPGPCRVALAGISAGEGVESGVREAEAIWEDDGTIWDCTYVFERAVVR